MRLPRTSLLGRLSGSDVPGVVLLEAPAGYGKSWLLRRAAGEGALRLRGELGPPLDHLGDATTIVIDDAHLLADDDLGRLVERLEDAPSGVRCYLAGRLLPDAVHEVTQLVDGLVLDADGLSLTLDEVLEALDDDSTATAQRILEAAEGGVRIVATALEQSRRLPGTDAIALTSRIVRATASDAMAQLTPHEQAVIGLLARAPGLERALLERLARSDLVERALTVGIPLRRQVTGGLELAMAGAFRSTAVDRATAEELAGELFDRGRAVEAIGLLLDAGDHDRAAGMIIDLSESITDTVEPQVLLGLLARLGPSTERQPLLLLRRATATRAIGRVDAARSDIDRASELARSGDPAVRRRVQVEAGRARLTEGRLEEAVQLVEEALVDLGEGEAQTYARAYELLAECATTSDARPDLQRAAECYRVAATAWEGSGEYARARACRRDLALGALVPLGRYDEALAQLTQVLATSDLSDAERSMTMLFEGFVLLNANRLESAESRFVRVTDIGYVQDNPRLIAAAAWGRAVLASRRGSLADTLRWISVAENTALTGGDDVHGVPFLCDLATALGALGELELAGRYLERAVAKRSVFPDQVASTAFILEARQGHLGDLVAALDCTPPAEWWRLKLAAAFAAASVGDTARALDLQEDSQRELLSRGFSDAASLGEGRLQEGLHVLLQRSAPGRAEPTPAAPARPAEPLGSVRVQVIGEPITVIAPNGTRTVVPNGNPQRLVGVVVAQGGSATFDQLSDAIWPGEEVETSRTRLRNVLLRMRRVVGDVVVRSGAGVRLAAGVECDLLVFERLASDALASARADPDLAGRLAKDAVEAGDGRIFLDFEYEEWAVSSRRSAEQQLIALFDLLSVQAEDADDLPKAQQLAERALRLDRYTDSRYVRLAELLTLQDRVAAAIAVLDDAAEVAREMGESLTNDVTRRRDQLVRGTAIGQ